jgi:diguanylate cyclase (GGDEF)-like protein
MSRPSRAAVLRVTREGAVLELLELLSNTYNSRLTELQAELAAHRAKIKDLESKIEIDPLVDVLNRRGLDRELNGAIAHSVRYGSSVAVIFIDLDNFKTINDRWGHPVGDEVLRMIAKALSRSVRGSDVVARVGGDEFAVLLWNISESGALGKARAIEQIITATEIPSAGRCVSVGASAGVAMIGPGDCPNDVMARADAEMYARKSQQARRTNETGNMAA